MKSTIPQPIGVFAEKSISLVTRTLIIVAMLLVATLSFAQRTTGTLRGQVLDPQGAAVANAEVTITNQATGVSEKLTTTSAGTYQDPSILPGKYTVPVNAHGFKEFRFKRCVGAGGPGQRRRRPPRPGKHVGNSRSHYRNVSKCKQPPRH